MALGREGVALVIEGVALGREGVALGREGVALGRDAILELVNKLGEEVDVEEEHAAWKWFIIHRNSKK